MPGFSPAIDMTEKWYGTPPTAGATLPVAFKLGDDDNPEYVVFETLETLTAFYTGAMQFVQKTLLDGWNAKDAIDLELYRVN